MSDQQQAHLTPAQLQLQKDQLDLIRIMGPMVTIFEFRGQEGCLVPPGTEMLKFILNSNFLVTKNAEDAIKRLFALDKLVKEALEPYEQAGGFVPTAIDLATRKIRTEASILEVRRFL